ncbi:MAG TPA: TerB family tellurite resistance protein [Sandaracinaceae bacterium LLY-WYZ-13_1]|nr:TerB family tellurite resistance protein [Sandaracinaceae bacterium LLY-WYZ-13_1]
MPDDVSPRFFVLTDLLLGAVHADDRLEGGEEEAVRAYLLEMIGGEELPIQLEARIANFDPASFALAESVREFEDDPATDKRTLLELVAAVFDADGEVDFAEDDYLRELASELGMDEDEYGDLVIEYDIEEPRAAAEVLVSLPPPVPKG